MLKEGSLDLKQTSEDILKLLALKKDVLDKELEKKAKESIIQVASDQQREQDIENAKKLGDKKREAEYLEKIRHKKKINKEVGRKIEEKVRGICHRQVGGRLQ